jgi:hypothetical protein
MPYKLLIQKVTPWLQEAVSSSGSYHDVPYKELIAFSLWVSLHMGYGVIYKPPPPPQKKKKKKKKTFELSAPKVEKFCTTTQTKTPMS